MTKQMKRCTICSLYTLLDTCPKCGEIARSPHPPRFSKERDTKYSKYRRFYKSEKKMFEEC